MGNEKIKEFFKWYLAFDAKDIWNWVLLIVAGYLLWWGIKTIIAGLAMPMP